MAENVPISPVVDMHTRKPYIDPANVPLSEETEFGGGDGGGSMEPGISMKDYVDSRDDAIESRLGGKLDKLPSAGQLWAAVATIAGAVFTGVAIILATLAFGSDRFNGGMSVSPAIAQAQTEQRKTDEAQDAKLEMMDRKLDILVERTKSK